MRPRPGWLTSRSPSGVQVSIRALGTRAHTRAVHPGGTVTVRGVANTPPPSPGGMTRSTLDRAAAGGTVVVAGAEAGAGGGAAGPQQATAIRPAPMTARRARRDLTRHSSPQPGRWTGPLVAYTRAPGVGKERS